MRDCERVSRFHDGRLYMRPIEQCHCGRMAWRSAHPGIQHVAASISASRILLVLRKSDFSEIVSQQHSIRDTINENHHDHDHEHEAASHRFSYRQTSCGSLKTSRIRPTVVFDLRRPTDTLRRESGVLFSKACKTRQDASDHVRHDEVERLSHRRSYVQQEPPHPKAMQ